MAPRRDIVNRRFAGCSGTADFGGFVPGESRKQGSKTAVTTLVVSDPHIGSSCLLPDKFVNFLEHVPVDATIVLNGDIVHNHGRVMPDNHRQILDRICDEAETAIDDGYSLVILSDRNVGPERVPLSALLACGAVHHHLIILNERHLRRIRSEFIDDYYNTTRPN